MSRPNRTGALPPALDVPLPTSLAEAVRSLRLTLEPCGDVEFRRLMVGSDPAVDAVLIACRPLIDTTALNELVQRLLALVREQQGKALWTALSDGLPLAKLERNLTVGEAANRILHGQAALLAEGSPGVLLLSLQRPDLVRSIQESQTEGVVRGPRDGFVESLETNLGQVRLRLPTPDFRVEQRQIGTRTRTDVALLWIEGIAQPQILAEVRSRLDRIQIDGVLESAYLEEMIEDASFSPFPTIEHTERPDKVAGALLDGRVAIMTANTPFALIAPVTILQFLKSAEDYYTRAPMATFVRLLRFGAFWMALSLPSIWIAVTTYHHEMIPSPLFVSLASQREGVPWPAFIEALLMEVSFELLREAGLRLPRPIGQSISIVGGLVIGEAAIRAKIAAPGMVIVVALTGISSFVIPGYNMALSLRLLRFPLMLAAGTLGLHGVVIGVLMILIHLMGLRSFGVPYLAPIAPAFPAAWKDVVLRVPWWKMRTRPSHMHPQDQVRVPEGQRPGPGVKP